MNKTALALMLAAALPAAHAQTSLKLTGSVDVSLESLNKDANEGEKGDLHVSDGVWGGSKVKIEGKEQISEALSGIFKLEMAVNADNGAQANEDRFFSQSWVGLEGGFGAVRFGRQDTALQLALDSLGDMTEGSWYYNGDGLAGFIQTRNNMISYETPELGGFVLYASYAAGEAEAAAGAATAADLNKQNDLYSVSARGEIGPFAIGLGYQSNDGAGIENIKSTDELGVALGLNFERFGVGVGAVQSQQKHQNGLPSIKNKGYSASTRFQVSDAGTVYLSYRREDPAGENNLENGIGLSYAHGLSKRTYLYGSVGIGKIETAAGQDDLKPRRVALGVRHFF
ncbi:MAG: porin [Lautropia sp.]|nr:porin [Lautropia sp.]